MVFLRCLFRSSFTIIPTLFLFSFSELCIEKSKMRTATTQKKVELRLSQTSTLAAEAVLSPVLPYHPAHQSQALPPFRIAQSKTSYSYCAIFSSSAQPKTHKIIILSITTIRRISTPSNSRAKRSRTSFCNKFKIRWC